MITKCIECGKDFDFMPTSYKSMAICSDECKMKRRRRKQAEWGRKNTQRKIEQQEQTISFTPKYKSEHMSIDQLLYNINKSMCMQGVIVYDIPGISEKQASYLVKGTSNYFFINEGLTVTCLDVGYNNKLTPLNSINYPIKYCYLTDRQLSSKIFMDKIKASCKEIGITQMKLADALNMTSSALHNVIKTSSLSPHFVEQLQEILNMEIVMKFIGRPDIDAREVMTRLCQDKLQLDFMEDFGEIIGAKFYYDFI